MTTTPAKPAKQPRGEMTKADYEATYVAMMDTVIAALSELPRDDLVGHTDCEKAAAPVAKFLVSNKPDLAALKSFEKAHPGIKLFIEGTKHRDKKKAFDEALDKMFGPCKDTKAMQDALKQMD